MHAALLKRALTLLQIRLKSLSDPKGCNVVLEKKYGAPLITNDGVTIAKEIELEDPFENMGAQLVREVAAKQMTLQATAQQQQQFLLRRSFARA